jgi:hypothetical protein
VTLRVFLTVFEIVLVIGTLAYFLSVVSRQLMSISATLGKITFGVRAVLTQCQVIGPSSERINRNLQEIARGLDEAAARAGRLAR